MSEPIHHDVAMELVADGNAYRKYLARIAQIASSYDTVMRRLGWRRLYGCDGPWCRSGVGA